MRTAASLLFLAGLVLPAAAAAAGLTIGTAGPMKGEFAVFGKQMADGARQAVADINAAGGVLGQPVALQIGDDLCDGKQAGDLANQMVGKGIVFMAGHFCSFASIPASAVYAHAGIIEISPASPNPQFTDQRPGPGIFRLAGRDDRQAKVAGAYLARHFAESNIAIVDDRSPYGKGLADDTRKYMNAAGKREIFTDSYTEGDTGFDTLIGRLKDASIDVLYIGGYPAEAGLIARAMRDQGLKTTIVSGDTLVTDEYWETADGAGEGTLLTFPPDARLSPAAASVIDEFRKAGIEPEGYVLNTYAAVQVWAEAVAAAGSADFQKVVDAISRGTFKTVLGDVKFDGNGDADLTAYVVYQWKNGRLEAVPM